MVFLAQKINPLLCYRRRLIVPYFGPIQGIFFRYSFLLLLRVESDKNKNHKTVLFFRFHVVILEKLFRSELLYVRSTPTTYVMYIVQSVSLKYIIIIEINKHTTNYVSHRHLLYYYVLVCFCVLYHTIPCLILHLVN